MFGGWKRERAIRRTLKKLARQRVALIVQPQGIKVLERALIHDDDTAAILLTCQMRGWVEVLEEGVPHGRLTADGRLPEGKLYDRVETLYRLTDSGWSAIHRSHGWALVGSFLGFLSLLATIAVAQM